jgi:hypothetical protein
MASDDERKEHCPGDSDADREGVTRRRFLKASLMMPLLWAAGASVAGSALTFSGWRLLRRGRTKSLLTPPLSLHLLPQRSGKVRWQLNEGGLAELERSPDVNHPQATFRLNACGTAIWLLCDGTRSATAIADGVAQGMTSLAEDAHRSVTDFLELLCEEHLLEPWRFARRVESIYQ